MKALTGACIIALCLSGCNGREIGDSSPKKISGMEETPIVDYTLPQMQPNILLNCYGYEVGSEKEAVVKGTALPAGFEVIDKTTDEVVYSGELTQVEYQEESSYYLGVAEFTEFNRPGTYYLRCDSIGESLAFSVGTEVYQKLFQEQVAAMESACSQDTLSLDGVHQLLIAYEWYPELFADSDGDRTPDTLKLMSGWIERNAKNRPQDGDYLVAVLAKFSYLYQNYDRKYANQCLQLASNIHSQITDYKNADSFYALTELYRASGLGEYGKQILEQFDFFKAGDSYLEQSGYLYGTMTYLSTRQQIDVNLCSILMDNMMGRAEEIAEVHGDFLHPVFPKNNGVQELTRKAFELACANYVMNNYQYDHVQEEFFHYLQGRNKDSRMLYEELEDRSSCLVLLAQLTNIYS